MATAFDPRYPIPAISKDSHDVSTTVCSSALIAENHVPASDYLHTPSVNESQHLSNQTSSPQNSRATDYILSRCSSADKSGEESNVDEVFRSVDQVRCCLPLSSQPMATAFDPRYPIPAISKDSHDVSTTVCSSALIAENHVPASDYLHTPSVNESQHLSNQTSSPQNSRATDYILSRCSSADKSGEESNVDEVFRSVDQGTLLVTSESPSCAYRMRSGELTTPQTVCHDSSIDMDDVYQAPDACYSILASHQHSGILNKLSKVDSWNTLTERLKHLLEWAARVTNTKSDSAISQTELLKFSDSLDIFRSQLDAFVRSSWRQDSAPVDVLLVCDRLGKLTLDLCQSVPLSKVQAFAQTDSLTGSTPLLTELL
ncbi:hypothetical protein AHF37_09574, partial [Paragonimus kellicotti]